MHRDSFSRFMHVAMCNISAQTWVKREGPEFTCSHCRNDGSCSDGLDLIYGVIFSSGVLMLQDSPGGNRLPSIAAIALVTWVAVV